MWRKLVVLGLMSWGAVAALAAAPVEASAASLPAQSAAPVLVASIKPVGWLLGELAPSTVQQTTIVPNGYSPHEYQLRPQDVALINSAELLVWVGPAMEPWLTPYAAKQTEAKQLALLPELRGHELNADGHGAHAHPEHDHNHADHHGHHEHEHKKSADPHLWLNPQLMQEAAVKLAAALSARYPQHQAEIASKLANFSARLSALDKQLAQDFKPVASVGFAVYHDAYSHLVARYGLNQVAAVWRHETVPPGAKARAILMQQLAAGDAVCMFYEPEHGADQVDKWLGKNSLRYSELDLLGQAVPAGAGGYEQFMQALSAQMISCLRQGKTQ